jgi:nucleoside transporter
MAQAAALDYQPPVGADKYGTGTWVRLSVMMFLQFAVWGSWFTVLGQYLAVTLKFSDPQIGSVYGTMALGAIVSMMVAGQLADRVLASEYLMAIFHIVGAVLLFFLSKATTYGSFWTLAFVYALVYNPTLTIANSMAFANIKDSVHFAWVRVFGTIGWIAAGLAVSYLLPAGSEATSTPLLMAAGLSLLLGVLSFALPHTPPSGKAGEALPFLRAFGLLRDPSFAIFFLLSFAITIALAFYYGFAGVFLGAVGVEKIAATMTLGQMSEIAFMLLLPFALRGLGMKWVLVIGMAAWVLRYGFFSAASDGTPFSLVVLGVLLHGVCFDFFLAAGFIHTENKAPASIRGSAQALFSFLTYGVGMWLGNVISGYVANHYSKSIVGGPDGGVTLVRDWQKIWMVPAVGAAVCLALFIVLWRDKGGKVEEDVAGAKGFPIEPVAITPATSGADQH